MYSLMMIGRSGGDIWAQNTVWSFEYPRIFEHTNPNISKEFLPISSETIDRLKGLPALLAYEYSFDGQGGFEDSGLFARVATVLDIKRLSNSVQFRYELDTDVAPIPMAVVASLSNDLDINVDGYEHYRSHWALKEVDLAEVLTKHGLAARAMPSNVDFAKEMLRLAGEEKPDARSPPKVFVVHGHDNGLKNEVALFLQRLGLEAIILHEQANEGRTIIGKLDGVAREAVYAVILATPDDTGGVKGGAQQYRARQNVIFELGYFYAMLGPSRVAVLRRDEIEPPSDYDGMVYIAYDAPGAWKLALAKEFSALGIPFDVTKMLTV